MEQPKLATVKTGRKRGHRDSSLAETASKLVEVYGEKASYKIDPQSACHYTQQKLDINNFIRHFRIKHPEKAAEKGLVSDEPPAKKQRIVTKRSIAIDRQLFLEFLIKLVAYHNLPLAFIEWEGMVLLLDPLKASLGVTVDKRFMHNILSESSTIIKSEISKEVEGLLISLKIDSASRHHRHVLALLAQYALDGAVVTRTLGQ